MADAKDFDVVSPVDGRRYETHEFAGANAIEQALGRSERAFESWRRSPVKERAELVTALADALLARREELREMVAWQIGRPLAQADETARFALVTSKHVDASLALAQETYEGEPGIRRFVRRQAQGVHLSISPWNYPLGMLPWLVVAPILGGNTVILKHAEQTAGVGRILQEAYEALGGPAGVLQTLNLQHDDAGKLIGTGRLKNVNFIGSVRGGLQVHKAAAGTLTQVHLELGGKDPAYVRSDADLTSAVANLADGSFSNAGQSCCSTERLYVHAAVHDEFIERMKVEAEKWTLGNPITDGPAVGTVVRRSAAEYIKGQVQEAVTKGAKPFSTRQADDFMSASGGCYVAPVVLSGVDHSMGIMRDELFGPVACIQKVASDDEAIELMNDSSLGLTASVWTADIERGIDIADQVDTGTAFINRCDHVDLYLPWGGNKNSGIGRVNGKEGLLGVTNPKSFHVRGA